MWVHFEYDVLINVCANGKAIQDTLKNHKFRLLTKFTNERTNITILGQCLESRNMANHYKD